MDIRRTIAISIENYIRMASNAFDKTFPPEGVDPIDESLNGNDEEFESLDGINYITDYLTRISSFLGLPNRKLYKNKGQSWQNLLDNFLGKQDKASRNKSIRRAAIMVPLNLISIPLKFLRNILKFFLQFIPLTCSDILWDIAQNLQKNTFKWWADIFFNNNLPVLVVLLSLPIAFIGFLLLVVPVGLSYGLRWIFKSIYLTDRALLDPYDSVRSAWTYGINNPFGFNKPLAYFLSGLSIITTLIMFCVALPIAAKLFAISVGPSILHYLPTVIDNVLIKIAHAIAPTLSAIGYPLTAIITEFLAASNLAFMLTYPVLIHIPALVGGSLFFATAIATVGLVANKYINNFKAWWNFDPNFAKPELGEGICSTVLDQQFDMLCILSEKNLSEKNAAAIPATAHELPVPSQVDVVVPLPASPLPTESLRKQPSSNTVDVELSSASNKNENHEEDRAEEEKKLNISLCK